MMTKQKKRAGHKPNSVSKQSSVSNLDYSKPQAIFQKMTGRLNLLFNLAPDRSLPSRYLSIPLVVFYTTVAPEPQERENRGCLLFCGTCPTVACGGCYPSVCPWVFGLSSHKNFVRDCSSALKNIISQN